MIIVWFILGMAAAWFMTAQIFRKTDLVKIAALGAGFYFSAYTALSGLMIWTDHFSVTGATICTFVVGIITDVFLVITKTGRIHRIRFIWKSYIPLAIMIALAAFLSCMNHAEMYYMGQDSGPYQSRAMFYLGGYNSNVIDFPEIGDSLNEWEKWHYIDELKDLDGFYADYPSDENIAVTANVSGVTHGINTFPAALALWGKMFGLDNMPGILTVFYLLLIAYTWFICVNLKFKTSVRTIITAVMVLCPIVLWNSQNTLPEIMLAAFLAMSFELISEGTKKRVTFMSAVPLVAFAFVHIQMTILMPLFVCIYLINYFYTKHRGYLNALLVVLASYVCGFIMMFTTARVYVNKNFDAIYNKTHGLVGDKNIVVVVCITSIIAAALVVVMKLAGKRFFAIRLSQALKGSKTAGKNARIVIAVVLLILTGIYIYKAFTSVIPSDMRIARMSVMGLLQMTGFVILPFAFIAMIYKGRDFFKDRFFASVVVSVIYVLILYCRVVVPQVYYYFYFARYLTPFIFLIPVAAGFILNRVKPKYMIPLPVIGILVMIWQSRILYTDQDLTYSQYEIMESIASCVTDNDAVLINEQGYRCQRIFLLPIKALTGADIFFVDQDNIDTQLAYYRSKYDDVFCFTYDIGHINEESGTWRPVYKGTAHGSIYETYFEYVQPYPLKTDKLETPVVLYIAQ